jgi:putative addiction module component (TIGR02574 family)
MQTPHRRPVATANSLSYTCTVSNEAERILEAAMKLSDGERAELAAILADSIGDGHSEEEIEAAWIAEAKRRLEDIRSGKSKTVPWEEVRGKLRAMLEGARQRRASAG